MIISWIHTLILTHISDVEAASVGAVVGGPAQQQLVAGGGHAEGRLDVTAQGGHALAVDVGTWVDRNINSFTNFNLHAQTALWKCVQITLPTLLVCSLVHFCSKNQFQAPQIHS